tara:strand:+ start:14563 stop:15666 length:1104 start_codon:yes stop_codon:yes gene_type:complete
MNGNDTYLNINDAHLRVTSGNVHASGFMLDQISIVTTDTTGSTIGFLNDTTSFITRSNIEIGNANLFVDTTTSCIGVNTNKPEYSLDVHGSVNVETLSFTSLSGDGTTLTGVARSDDLTNNSSRITTIENSTSNHSSLLSLLRRDVDTNYALSIALASSNIIQETLIGDIITNLESNANKISSITSDDNKTTVSSNLKVMGNFNATGVSEGATHESSSTLYLLSIPFYKEWQYVNYVSPSVKVTFNPLTEIPIYTSAILADVYLSRDSLTVSGDHQIHILGRDHSSATNWHDGYITGAPSTYFGNSVGSRQVASIMMPGQNDGFTHNYGLWYTSVIIPLQDNKIYYSNFGNDNSTGWVYIHIRGYYI